MKLKPLFFAILLAALCSCGPDLKVYDLTCEGLTEPLAIDSPNPHFSWKIASEGDVQQAAWEIQVATSPAKLKSGSPDIWSSGKVESPDQIMVPYGGEALSSRQLCWWRVRVVSSEGKMSQWSVPQRFAIGVIAPDSLEGQFIGTGVYDGQSPLVRKQFSLESKAKTAFLHVNSLGYHEAYVNGVKVSDAVLQPAVSQMDKRSLITTYDVSKLLVKGENEVMLWIGEGWYRKDAFRLKTGGPYVKAELDVLGAEGWKCALSTDDSWEWSPSGYSDYNPQVGNIIGERIEAGVEPSWSPVTIYDCDIAATPQMCEPATVQETVSGVSVRPDGDAWVVDMGRVVNGFLEVSLPQMAAGQKIDVQVHDIDFPKDDEGGNEWYEYFGAYSFTASGKPEGDCFKAKFHTNVIRYVRFSGLDKAPEPSAVKVHRVRTNYAEASSFECSDPDIQSIHDMIRYTMQNLAFAGYMVDCANLERLGYGGDGNASTLSLQTMFDVAPLYMNWVQAWGDAIQSDGGLPHTAPCPWSAGGGPYWCTFLVQAPWRTYMSYGDSRLIERMYPKMKQWLNYVDTYSYGGLLHEWPATWYRNWYLGDWLAPEGSGVDVTEQESKDLVNNCALCQAYQDLVAIAGILGDSKGEKEFTSRLNALRARIHEVFYNPSTGLYGTGSQLDMSYPLLVGVVPPELKETVTANLLKRSAEEYKGHLAVGLVGVPVLTEWATLNHQADFVYGMLKQKGHPGYLHMILSGGTGTWESWEGRRSHFHNCYNGIGSWFYQALGGIIPLEPGYRKVKIDPQMPQGLDWVKVTKETPYGPITVSWDNSKGQKEVSISVPVGVTVVR